MNKVILIGRLTKDPEIKYTQAAEPLCVARYTLAVNRRFKREGEQEADFIGCVAFGKSGEFAERFLKKGMQIAITGRIQVRTWDDQNGQKRWSTDIVIDEQEFTESKAAYESRAANVSSNSTQSAAGSQKFESAFEPEGFAAIAESIDDDDLPF